MKKFTLLVALLAMMGSCSEEYVIEQELEEQQEQQTTSGISVTANITMSQTDDELARVASDYGTDEWIFSWESGDAVYMLSHGSSAITTGKMTQGTLASDYSSAEYSGTIETDAVNYSLLHASDDVTFEISGTSATLSLSTVQDGDLNSMAMVSDVNSVSGISDDGGVAQSLKHICSFMVLDISFANVPDDWSDVTLSKVEYSGVNTSCTIDLSKDVEDGDFYGTYGEQET